MHQQPSDIFASQACPGGICVVDGYGLRVAVERKQLVIADGLGRFRRVRRFSRADRSLRRVVVIGNSGTISLDALRWLGDVKVPLVHIDAEGRVLATSAVWGTDNPKLRRAQALAMDRPIGLELARSVITDKLQGQLRVASQLPSGDGARQVIEAALGDLEGATSLDEIRTAEAVAASAYWPTWIDVPVRFAKVDASTVPALWRSVGQRRSPLSQSARSAVTPAQAALNYLYALLAAEARVACLTMGLDPGMGFLHADKGNRDSLVADVMEPVRPEVDAYVLELLERRTFRAPEFAETRQGSCRLLAPLTHELAESSTLWADLVAPVVEQVATELAKASGGQARKVATPLTQRSRAAAVRQGLKPKRLASKGRPKALAACRTCGGPLPRPDYLYCGPCRAIRRSEHLNDLHEQTREAARSGTPGGRLEHTRTEAVLGKIRTSMEQRNRELREWKERGGVEEDPEVFRREIQPHLIGMSVRRIQEVTGLSRKYAYSVRQGEFVPHCRHWPAFRALVSDQRALTGDQTR